MMGSVFFYSEDAPGHRTGSQTLYIPYVGIAGVVLILAVIFYFADVPDIQARRGIRHRQLRRSRISLLLVAAALRWRGGGAVLLRGGAGRHFQFLHQLHDGGNACRSRGRGSRR